MPNITLQANAISLPRTAIPSDSINAPLSRRTACSSIAALGAMLAAPATAALTAHHPDIRLLALARRAKAIGLDSDAADEALDKAEEAYEAEAVDNRAATGLPELEAKAGALRFELRTVWRELAFMPARTIEGVLAKLDAVSDCFFPLQIEHHPVEFVTADDVVEMAIVQLTALRNAVRP